MTEVNATQLDELVDRYFAMWNETDAKRRRDIIARTWTETATYLDPMLNGEGREGIDAMVDAVQARFPGHTFRLRGPIDGHHDRIRFAWDLASDAGVAVVSGVDFGVVADGARLETITGFLDNAPTA